MRDTPLKLHVAWGKKKDPFSAYRAAWAEYKARAEQKKEKPRGNGALNGGKQ